MFKGGKLKFKSSNKSDKKSDFKSNSDKQKEEIFVLPKEITSLPDDGWIRATEADDFLGPVIFIIPGDAFCLLKISEEGGILSLEGPSKEDEKIPNEPISTANVIVGQNLIPHVFSFKSAFGKYLATDSLGQVSFNKDAVNALAEWNLLIKPEGVSLESVNQKFLSFDPKTGKFRCDSDTIGFNETFIIKCQADRKKRRLIERFQSERRSNSQPTTSEQELLRIEETEMKRMQSSGLNQNYSKSVDLKRAAEEGNLRETLLERRIKSKHDPFC